MFIKVIFVIVVSTIFNACSSPNSSSMSPLPDPPHPDLAQLAGKWEFRDYSQPVFCNPGPCFPDSIFLVFTTEQTFQAVLGDSIAESGSFSFVEDTSLCMPRTNPEYLQLEDYGDFSYEFWHSDTLVIINCSFPELGIITVRR